MPLPAASSDRPRVAIVGAGFGGLAAARALRSAPVDTLLVDQHNFHAFSPLLYQVATAMLEPAEIAQPVRSLLRKAPNANFRMGRVTGVDLDGHEVLTDHEAIGYDYLILAAGSVNNYFGNAGIASNSYGLNDLPEAIALRNRILTRCEQAAWTHDDAERRRLLTFVVVGGGPTGVEFAGSLAEFAYGVLGRDFPDLDLDEASIVLVEASEAPLPPFAPSLQRAAARALEKRRVRIVAGQVADVGERGARLADGQEIAAGTVVWAAGVRAEPLAEGLGVELGSLRRIPVGETLQLDGRSEVFVVGDLAEIAQDGTPLPMLAQVAMQSGVHAARGVEALVAGSRPPPFGYRDFGTMATIGRNDAVAQIGRIKLKGFVGWLAWLVVHLARTAGMRARLSVVIDWFAAYLLVDRPSRLIVGPREIDLSNDSHDDEPVG